MFYSYYSFLCLLFNIVAGDGLGKGIVTKVFSSGSSTEGERMQWTGEPEVPEYKHYVECDYIHKYPYRGPLRKFRFELHCLSFGEVNGAPDYTVFIDYDYNVLDRFKVTSCNPEDVINSIFIPRQRNDYPEKDNTNLPNTHYIRYITTDNVCHERKYEFTNRISTMAKRLDPKVIPCPSNLDEWLNPSTGWFTKFGNCRVPIVPVPHTVVDWVTEDKPLEWYPGSNDDNQRYQKLLQCNWDRLTYEWKILCVKVEEGEEYYKAFVSYGKDTKEMFTVTSCKEQDLVNSIFPPRYTTAHPSGWPSLRFAGVQKDKEGKELCYQRFWLHLDEPEVIPCPKYDDEWLNPTQGFAGMFGNCEIPRTEEPHEKEVHHKTTSLPGPKEIQTHESGQTNKVEEHKIVAGNGKEKGIVTKAFSSGSRTEGEFMQWTGEPEVPEYKHYVECDYIHNYEYWGSMRKFRFELHCLSFGEVNGAPDYTVFIDYDYNVLDRFNVTSCNPEDVINSIFVPRQRNDYPDIDEEDLPNTHHIRYITTDNVCHERKYEFTNRISRMAKRLDPKVIPCPSNFDEWLNPSNGWFAKFGNCRVPIVPVPHTVIDWVTEDKPLDWYPGWQDENKRYKKLLQCDWDRLASEWKILCVKVEGEKYYKAFVSYGKYTKEMFTVTSCKEQDLVNSIFPPRFTTAHPSGRQSLRFAGVQKDQDGNKLCYQRYWGNSNEPKIIPCPKYDDDWVNPTQGFAGMFGHCKVLGTEEPHGKEVPHKTTSGSEHESGQTHKIEEHKDPVHDKAEQGKGTLQTINAKKEEPEVMHHH